MKVVELFCGTKSFSNVAGEQGHQTFTVDIEQKFNPDLCKDIFLLKRSDLPFMPDIIWASPPCQCFSVATIGRNWNKDYTPKTYKAERAIALVGRTIQIIESLNPRYWFIENPRCMLRKLMPDRFHRKTVTYCQYGDTRMKPTDIWTNLMMWNPKPPCKNGDKCHVAAPRGSRTGTQGLKNSTERGRIPKELCLEIINKLGGQYR